MTDIAFIDSETLSLADLPTCGAYAYAANESSCIHINAFNRV